MIFLRCTLASAIVLSATPSFAQQVAKGDATLWGGLKPGPYAVGYRVEFARDKSRTWRVTKRYGSILPPDTSGRPVRISVWYPASLSTGHRLRFGDYARTSSPLPFADFNLRLEQRDSSIFRLTVKPEELPQLLGLPTSALADPAPAPGRFPLVLVIGGLNAETTAQAVLAEFLASHGYVVATVPWTGLTEDEFDAARTPANLEATARDFEFAWSMLRTKPNVDPRKFAVAGHSLGGIIAAIIGMRNSDAGAVVGLDATYGFADASGVLTGFYSYAPQRMTAPLFDLRKAAREQNTHLDLAAEHAFYFSDRTFVTIQNIRHSEFTTYSLISAVMHEPTIPPQFITPGWSRTTAFERYQQAIEMVGDFLDAKMKGDPARVQRLEQAVSISPNATISVEVAIPVPPSTRELVAIAKTNGLDSAKAIIGSYTRNAPGISVATESALNNLGYEYLAQKRYDDAVIAFQLMVAEYPTSENAFDSYGDGLAATGRSGEACLAYKQSVALASADKALSTDQRASLVSDETTKTEHACGR